MSAILPLANTLPAAILETILSRLALLFLSGAAGDMTAARQAAIHMLAEHHPETEDELRLAANIVSFSYHALEALGQATDPDMPLTRVLRLRSGAVALSRESDKARNRLDQLRQARREAASAQIAKLCAEPAQADTQPARSDENLEKALDLIQDTSTVSAVAKANGLTWTQAYEQRQRDTRIAASLKRAEARIAAQANVPPPGAIPGTQAISQAL
jgi:methionine salvage enolase-phosphatase E1